MNTPENAFSDLSFVLVKLLRQAVYREDNESWQTLRAGTNQEKARHYFRQIGQELVMDEAEGYAFLRQLEIDGVEKIPRLTQRRPLSYSATLLLVCLREEFSRFETASPDSTHLIKTRTELQNLVAAFLPESSNQVKDLGRIDSAIQRLAELGFLEAVTPEKDTFEVMRIVKARITPVELETIKEKLKSYATGTD
jgi:hypothetical protein